MSLPPLIRALLDSRSGPFAPASVDLVETHAAWVLLTGDWAYKIKKPVTLPFLDYGTLEKRRTFCEAELRLNRRYTARLYVGVVAIVGTPEAPRLDNDGEAIEYAVKMRRFDEAMRLDHLVDRDELTPTHIACLAGEIADFHAQASVAAADTRFGTPEQVLAPALENFVELTRLMPEARDQARLADLEAWTRREFKHRRAAFAARKAAGQVRECHGDLHLRNLVLLGQRVVPFDCIEFNDDFRWTDVAAELAFTLVDLVDHDKPGLACWLLNEWLERTGDHDALNVLRFYTVYRALVRAKVAAIRAGQEEGAAAGQDVGAARGYLDLAFALASPPPPTLTITHGVAGAGKSRASRQRLLADACCATVRLRSDVERKRLFGLAATTASRSPVDGGIYTPAAHVATYRHLAQLARFVLQQGWSVVVDAAFLRRDERDDFHRLAAQHDAPFTILWCAASPEELRRRVSARRGDASEATLDVLEKQLTWVEAPGEDEAPFVVRVPVS